MQTSDAGIARSVMVVCLLVLALALIAMGVSATAQHDFGRLPQLVHDALKSAAGNI